MSVSTKRRFIAGAVCPRCAAMDKIVVDLTTDKRSCVSCDFTEERPEAGVKKKDVSGTSERELSTRVSRPAARRVETPAEPVRLVDPLEKKTQ